MTSHAVRMSILLALICSACSPPPEKALSDASAPSAVDESTPSAADGSAPSEADGSTPSAADGSTPSDPQIPVDAAAVDPLDGAPPSGDARAVVGDDGSAPQGQPDASAEGGATARPDDAATDATEAGDQAGDDDGGGRGARPVDRGHVVGLLEGGQGPNFPLRGVEDIEAAGYQIEEWLIEGDALAYEAVGAQGIDGRWQAKEASRAAYQTRLVVVRPPAESFNGTVFVEWLNVTTGQDASVAYRLMSAEFLRGGYGYVGVSLQKGGIDALQQADAARYGKLSHPGDTYSYDILTQAGVLVGWPGDLPVMGELKVERILAYGQSQSAMRMVTYVNAIHPGLGVFDGFFIQSRAGFGAPIGDEFNELIGNGDPVHVREDIEVPVLQLFTETEIFMPIVVPSVRARQPDTDRLRSWEVAGAAHADRSVLDDPDVGCGQINDGPLNFVAKAAMRALHLWIKDGTAPPKGEPITVNAEQTAIVRDDDGNALGGIRTPDVDVPIARLTGEAPTFFGVPDPLCMMYGQTEAFSASRLSELYPTHQDYVDKVIDAARQTREAGFILAEEELAIVEEAKAAPIPN